VIRRLPAHNRAIEHFSAAAASAVGEAAAPLGPGPSSSVRTIPPSLLVMFLDAWKLEYSAVADCAGSFAFPLASPGMAGVLDHEQAPVRGDLGQSVHVGHMSREMHGNYGSGLVP